MKTRTLLLAACFVCTAVVLSSAETMPSVKMGPAWPKELRETNSEEGITAWEPSIEYGMLFDRRVGIGLDLEFQWKRRLDDSTYYDLVDSTWKQDVDMVERFFLFPPCLFLYIDPVPDLIIHPAIRGQIGMTLLYYSKKGESIDEDSREYGIYYGVYGKAGVDALYDIGESVSVFAGFEFQFGNARRRVDRDVSQYYKKQVYGPGVRMGFRFLM